VDTGRGRQRESDSFVGEVGSLVLHLFSAGDDLGSATLHFKDSMEPPWYRSTRRRCSASAAFEEKAPVRAIRP
jgi:hypothetical protein